MRAKQKREMVDRFEREFPNMLSDPATRDLTRYTVLIFCTREGMPKYRLQLVSETAGMSSTAITISRQEIKPVSIPNGAAVTLY